MRSTNNSLPQITTEAFRIQQLDHKISPDGKEVLKG